MKLMQLRITTALALFTLGAAGLAIANRLQAREAPEKEKVAYLGVIITPVDEALRQQLKLARGAGLQVSKVEPGTPAEKAGVKVYDVLEQLDDQVLFNGQQLTALVRSHKSGDKVTLTIVREGQRHKLEAVLAEKEMPVETGLRGLEFEPGGMRMVLRDVWDDKLKDLLPNLTGRGRSGPPSAYLGVELEPVGESLASQLALGEDQGALIGHVVPDSPADKAGLKKHDVVLQLDQESVKGPESLSKAVRKHAKGDQVKVTVLRGGKRVEIEATLGEQRSPEPAHWRSLLKDFQVVPRVRVLRSAGGKGEADVVLERLEPGKGDTVAVVRRAEGPGHTQTITHTVRSTGAESGKTSTRARVQVEAQRTGASQKVIEIESPQGHITVKEQDGKRHALIKDPDQKVVFDGPINTPEEKAKVPAEFRETLDRIGQEVQLKELPGEEVKELKVLLEDDDHEPDTI